MSDLLNDEARRIAAINQQQIMDRNGVWTDRQSRLEGFPSITFEEAEAKIFEVRNQ
jgi:hypothetical protein